VGTQKSGGAKIFAPELGPFTFNLLPTPYRLDVFLEKGSL